MLSWIQAFNKKDLHYMNGGYIFSQYGWYMFAGLVVLGIYWNKIQKRLDRWYDKRESRKYAEKYHKNPDLALERVEAMERARKKQQEELNRKAIEYQEKMKEREQQLMMERIARAEKLLQEEGGHRLGNDSSPSSSKGLKSDYNPLMGDSSSRYKPQKRSGCSGGGCGGGR
ncbi:selenoprotein S isoform X2 [Halyomorpha halys]|uniref:selenoprotein S isoform X2 n=1 Tax=Halyomorpha halys TaxID=286706 RepID=UPI0006D4FE16|nr:selenoprotein S-like isoform X2 [Halyomorpha halys]